jgi:NADH:ubiquinone oxidoreductase subunit 3 (subunit A)
MDVLFAPPIAFLIYMALVGVLAWGGAITTDSSSANTNTSTYASGEAPPSSDDRAIPGYRPFFTIALFFAILHLGVVILATSTLSAMALLFLFGLVVSLIALILG